MSASGAGWVTTGIGPVDALIDVARGPCVDSVAVRGEVAEALLGLAGAVGEAMPKTGQRLGVEGQLEALGRIEAGLALILEEERGKLHARAERGLKRLCWCVQAAQRAVRDMVRGTLVRDEWVDGARLDRVYRGIVGAWDSVSAAASESPGQEGLLRALAVWAAEHAFGLPKLNGEAKPGKKLEVGCVEVVKGVVAAQTMLSVASERLSEKVCDFAGAASDVAGIGEALGKLESLGVPEVEVVEGDGVGVSVDVGLSGGGRAFLSGDGGGMVVEWRSEFKVPVWMGDEGESEWAAKCAEIVRGLALGQQINVWAEAAGVAPPVHALRGVAVSVEQSRVSGANPLGAYASLLLQVTMCAGVPVAEVVGDEAWEDVQGDVKAGVARECLDVLSACEESGAGYIGGGVLGALVVEGSCGMSGGIAGVAGDVLRGVASVRLCAVRVGQVVGEVGCGEWNDALRDVMGLERGGGGGGADGGVLASFDEGGVWGSGMDVSGSNGLVCAAQAARSGCGVGVDWARSEVGDGAMGHVWDAVAAGGESGVEGLCNGVRAWRVEVKEKGGVGEAGRCSGLVDVVGKVGHVCVQGYKGSGCVGVWRCLMGGGDVVERVAEHMNVVAGDGHRAWCEKDAVDVESMIQAAEEGDAWSCWELGVMYAEGKCVEKDEEEAVRWYRAAAKQGHAEGQYLLGDMYANGTDVGKDEAEAVRWYRAAAEQGHAGGQTKLGVMYARGIGVGKDEAEAVRWLKAAAEQGHAKAQSCLGAMHANVRGSREDYAEAVRLLRAAAEQGHAKAQYKLSDVYASGNGVKKDKYEAMRWLRAAAEKGHAEGQYRLGAMYLYGKDVGKDYAEAARWLRAAAEQGHAGGQNKLGAMYASGRGVGKDHAVAVRWYRAAAKQGHAGAKARLKRL